jgi:hypothetical protein
MGGVMNWRPLIVCLVESLTMILFTALSAGVIWVAGTCSGV